MIGLRKYVAITAVALSISLVVVGAILPMSGVSADGSIGEGCVSFVEPLPDDRYDSRFGISGDGEEPPQEEFDQRGEPFTRIVADSKHPDGQYEDASVLTNHGNSVVDGSDFNIWQSNKFTDQSSGFSCIPDTVVYKIVDQNDTKYR